MLRILTTNSTLICSHGSGQVQLGPGADWLRVEDNPALRVIDVLNRSVQKCPYCKTVVSVMFGPEDCLDLEKEEGDERVLTELAFGATNAGTWSVLPQAGWSVQIAPASDPPNIGFPLPASVASSTQKEEEESKDDETGPLLLTEWQSYLCPKPDPASFEPDPKPLDVCGREGACDFPLKLKWLYVFDAEGRRPLLFREYWVTEEGFVEVDHPEHLRQARRLRLPLKKGRKPKRYAFLAALVRLTKRAAERCAASPELAPVEVKSDTSKVCATDPLSVASQKAIRFADARDILLELTSSFPIAGSVNAGPAARKAMLARLIGQLMDEHPKLGLAAHISEGGDSVRRFLASHAQDVERWAMSSEWAADQLIRWLQGELWKRTVEAYAERQGEHFSILISTFARCLERLPEVRQGRKYLTQLVDDKRHLIHDYVLRSSEAGEQVFQVVRKSAEAVVTIWNALLTADLPRSTFKPGAYVRGLNYSFRVEVVIGPTPGDLYLSIRAKTVRFDYIEMVEERTVIGKASHWLESRSGLEKALGRLRGSIEIVNFGLALKKCKEGEPEKRLENILGLVGATLDGMKLFLELKVVSHPGASKNLLSRLKGPQLLHGLGLLGAMCDGIVGLKEAVDSLAINSPNAAAGKGISAAGAAAIIAGEWASLCGGGSVLGVSAGVWSGVGLGVVIAGIIYTVAFAETPLQLFAANSDWGEPPGAVSAFAQKVSNRLSAPQPPSWSTKPFRAWKGDFSEQLDSLCRLLAAFKVTAIGLDALRVEFGLILPSSRIEVVAIWDESAGSHHAPGCAVGWDRGAAMPLSGWEEWKALSAMKRDRGEERQVTFDLSLFTEDAKQARILYPGGTKPFWPVTCWVRLDLFGNSSLVLPGPNAWLELSLYKYVASGTLVSVVANPESVVSLDVPCHKDSPRPRRRS